MIRNYLLLALRNIRKHKLHNAINVGGLTVAFACSIFILLMVYRHFRFDDFHENKEHIYKVYAYAIGPQGEESGTAMAYPLTSALKTEGIGTHASGILTRGKLVRYKDKTLDMRTTLVDEDFLKMFSFNVIAGDRQRPLSDLSSTVLTKESADKLFGAEEPIGKQVEVKIGGEWYKLTVTGVTQDVPKNSTVNFSLLARSEINPDYPGLIKSWDQQNHHTYVQLANGKTLQQAEKELRQLSNKYRPTDVEYAKRNGYRPDENGDYNSFRLLPLTEEHFNTRLGQSTISKEFLYVLILICIVIILIAAFNFVNLNIGMSFTRTKEIGIRKYLGASKKQIWLQVWGESFLLVLVSMLLGLAVVVFLINRFNPQFDNSLDAGMLLNPAVLIILALLVIVVSFLASGYPSAVMSRLKTVEILKGKITVKRPGMLRNALIVTQFVIAIVLICCTGIIFQQFDYLRSAPLGYNTSSIISIPLKNDDKGRDLIAQMRTRLASQSSIVSVSGSDVNLGRGEDRTTSASIVCFDYEGKTICGQTINVDYDILKTMEIKPLEGHDFSMDYGRDSSSSIIATQSFADQFGKKAIAGFSYQADSAEPRVTIAGIIPDIQIQTLTNKQRPVVLYLSNNKSMSYLWVRVNTANPSATMDLVKKTYATVEPGVEFKGSYVNENIERLYQDEQWMARLFSIAAAIAITLSCIGLFGIASIVIRQRVKEIGVRKVLGASIQNILTLVSKEFLKPVIIALFIAVPIAWWGMNSWLQSYAHRVSIHWWVFALAGISAIVITIITISFQSIKAAIANPVDSLRTE